MKRKMRLLSVMAAVLLVVTSLSLAVMAAGTNYQIRITPRSNVSIRVGGTVSLDYYILGSDDYSGSVYWSSSNSNVAEVSSSGVVTGNRVGSATIRVETDDGKRDSISVSVGGSYRSDDYYDYYGYYYGDGYYYDGYGYYDNYGRLRYYYDEDGNRIYYYDDDDEGYYYYYDSQGVKRYYYGYYYYDENGYRIRTNPYSQSSSSSSTSSRSSTSSKAGTVSSKTSSADTVKLTEKASRSDVLDAVNNASGGAAILRNYASVSAESLQAAANVSKVNVCFDTRSGSNVVGRLTFNSATVSKLSGDIQTGVYCDTGNTSKVERKFSKNFYNRCKVVLIDQRNFGTDVEIAVKASTMSAQELNFYSYDAGTNIYTPINVSNVYKDSSDYLHFNTTIGGYIVVSEGTLTPA